MVVSTTMPVRSHRVVVHHQRTVVERLRALVDRPDSTNTISSNSEPGSSATVRAQEARNRLMMPKTERNDDHVGLRRQNGSAGTVILSLRRTLSGRFVGYYFKSALCDGSFISLRCGGMTG
jgi:hypothetical protein